MTSDEASGTAADQAPGGPQPLPSRRAVLRTAAGAGLAATAVTSAGGTALAAAARSAPGSALSRASAGHPVGDAVPEHDGEAIVVHLRDARSGEIDLFHGTRQLRLHDRELAARLIRASR